MTISQLIEQLQRIQAEHGDLEVFADHENEYGLDGAAPVTRTSFEQAYTYEHSWSVPRNSSGEVAKTKFIFPNRVVLYCEDG